MPNENKLYRALQSRKLWMALIGLILILVTSWNQEPFPTDAVVTAIMGVVGAYVASVAWEDGKQAEAIGKMVEAESKQVAPPSPVSIDAANVEVTSSEATANKVNWNS